MHTLGRALGHTSQRAANLHQRRMAAARSLPDAHAHPQDDLASAHILERSSVPCVAVMGVRETDWDNVLQLQRMLPSKVIPCFGVHPWFAHQHSVETLSSQLPEDQQLTEPQSASSSAQRESQGGTSGAALPSTTWVDRLESLLQVSRSNMPTAACHAQAMHAWVGLQRTGHAAAKHACLVIWLSILVCVCVCDCVNAGAPRGCGG